MEERQRATPPCNEMITRSLVFSCRNIIHDLSLCAIAQICLRDTRACVIHYFRRKIARFPAREMRPISSRKHTSFALHAMHQSLLTHTALFIGAAFGRVIISFGFAGMRSQVPRYSISQETVAPARNGTSVSAP